LKFGCSRVQILVPDEPDDIKHTRLLKSIRRLFMKKLVTVRVKTRKTPHPIDGVKRE
jgi:hypothetical protein